MDEDEYDDDYWTYCANVAPTLVLVEHTSTYTIDR